MSQLFNHHIQYNYLPKRPNRVSTDVLAIGFEPPDNASSLYGNLYLCFESHADDRRISTKHILERCGKAFYESGAEVDLEDRFRLCLRALNELIAKSKTTCNLAIVATQGKKLLFAEIGTITLLHSRKGKLTDLTNNEPQKIFSSIGTGSIISDDKIILASKAFNNSLTRKDISKLLSDYPFEDLEGILLSHLKPVKDIAIGFVIITTDIIPDELDDKSGLKIQNNNPKSPPKVTQTIGSITKATQGHSQKVKKKLQQSTRLVSKKIVPGVSTKTKQGWTTFWSKYINPNPKQAIIIVIITIIIIISIGLLASKLLGSYSTPAIKEFKNAIALIDSAQDSLNQNNHASAENDAKKAQQLLASINQSQRDKLNATNTQKQPSYTEVHDRLQEILDKITHTSRLSLNFAFPLPQSKISGLTWTEGSLFGIDPVAGSIVEINPLLGTPTVRATNPELIGTSSAGPLTGGGMIIVGKTGLWQYTSSGGLQQLSANNLPIAVDIASYLNNIYLLSPAETQVIRYSKAGTSLINRTSLLKDLSPNSMADTSALVVSGNIFVTQRNSIKLFEGGHERNYRLTNMPGDFGDLGKFFYNAEKGYFVVINKSDTRLAILLAESDSAKFIRQYALPNNAIIQSFTVEPTSSQLILFSDGKIVTHKIEK